MIWQSIFNDFVREVVGEEIIPGVRQNMVRALFARMEHAAVELPTGSELLGALRSVNLGIRTQDFYTIYNSTADVIERTPLQENKPYDEPFTEDELFPAPFRSRTKYVYSVSLEVYGESGTRGPGVNTFYYSSNELLSPEEVETQFFIANEDNFLAEEVNWSSRTFQRAYKRGPL